MSEQRKAVIKNADMEEKMQQDAVDIASKALSEYNIEKVCTGMYRIIASYASFLQPARTGTVVPIFAPHL
jgi:hypothetical protein